MKSIKDTLILIRDEIRNEPLIYIRKEINGGMRYEGLCAVAIHLYFSEKISHGEYNDIMEYIYKNPPLSLHRLIGKDSFYWPKYKKYPRLRWLNKHIRRENDKI